MFSPAKEFISRHLQLRAVFSCHMSNHVNVSNQCQDIKPCHKFCNALQNVRAWLLSILQSRSRVPRCATAAAQSNNNVCSHLHFIFAHHVRERQRALAKHQLRCDFILLSPFGLLAHSCRLLPTLVRALLCKWCVRIMLNKLAQSRGAFPLIKYNVNNVFATYLEVRHACAMYPQ